MQAKPFSIKNVSIKIIGMFITYCFVFFIVAILALATLKSLGY